MNAKDLRIVFMGTPEFAVTSLRALVEGGYNIVGVVTTPDKPDGMCGFDKRPYFEAEEGANKAPEVKF